MKRAGLTPGPFGRLARPNPGNPFNPSSPADPANPPGEFLQAGRHRRTQGHARSAIFFFPTPTVGVSNFIPFHSQQNRTPQHSRSDSPSSSFSTSIQAADRGSRSKKKPQHKAVKRGSRLTFIVSPAAAASSRSTFTQQP
ncbi:hypothetical protein SLEP1_g18385 [Rubroshorea leprosula]|uniref:Uncharacterized protein n=1 Tax=Rubroshorea leprosula TaxID=152421 RepID=A0AAV5J344_9ROSI|nr:hypothetical protein SLEP1_g18385 [Rubroshorea leprosula]